MKTPPIVFAFFATALLLSACAPVTSTTEPSSVPRPATSGASGSPAFPDPPPVTVVARNLEVPWALALLPDNSIVFTERNGRVRFIDNQGKLSAEPWLVVSDVAPRGEGGLLGIAVHPRFASNHFLYLYYTYETDGGLANKVARFQKEGNTLTGGKTIIENIPGATIHDGGRIKFGPDGLLYVTTGDASVPGLAQDKNSLAGKILRLKDDGTIPPDNPFPGSPVYSYGHRNPQGLAWDAEGKLWATEHGSSATDELNLIEPGRNYGWPTIRGDETAPGMVSPVIHSGAVTWAPSGMTFLDGSLYFASLRGESLLRVKTDQPPPELRRELEGRFGRLRDVVVGPNRILYVLTNNRDGRGTPSPEDDRILQINPRKF